LIEVVGEGILGDLFCLPTVGSHVELGLRRPPGRLEERGRSGLADVGETVCDGLGIRKERNEREGCVAGGTDQREDLL
jgi:hypothetical protein